MPSRLQRDMPERSRMKGRASRADLTSAVNNRHHQAAQSMETLSKAFASRLSGTYVLWGWGRFPLSHLSSPKEKEGDEMGDVCMVSFHDFFSNAQLYITRHDRTGRNSLVCRNSIPPICIVETNTHTQDARSTIYCSSYGKP